MSNFAIVLHFNLLSLLFTTRKNHVKVFLDSKDVPRTALTGVKVFPYLLPLAGNFVANALH